MKPTKPEPLTVDGATRDQWVNHYFSMCDYWLALEKFYEARILELEADKADLLRVLGVTDERIKALEALNSRLANDINCGELLPQSETPEENPRLRPIGFCPECLMAGGAHKLRCSKAPTPAETDCEHEWETLGVPEGSIRCKKCEKHDSSL